MKKKSIGLLAVLILLLGLVIPAAVQAETFNGSDDWKVTFTTDATLVSNFHNNVLSDTLSEMEPGDVARFQIELVSAHASDADWYMKNNVLYSLEDRSKNAATAGGGYTYRLVFTDAAGKENVLFSSKNVGGETITPAGEGLHEATDALKDYFYLGTFKQGQTGKMFLEVSLEGESQGNDYQDTLADLVMQFAVELPETKKVYTPKTGDPSHLLPYYIAIAAAGLILLVLAIVLWRKRKGDGEK
ncbi:MAG: hypothetical protein IJM69_09100 [Firmicutes bacterium]|nr:hypothetical protein [Bacillota bacterium]